MGCAVTHPEKESEKENCYLNRKTNIEVLAEAGVERQKLVLLGNLLVNVELRSIWDCLIGDWLDRPGAQEKVWLESLLTNLLNANNPK